jgi:uncharacterized membrane protein
MKGRTNRKAVVLKAIWVYSTIIWLYIAIENLVYPAEVYGSNFSLYIPIRTDLLGIISFAASFVFYILLHLYKQE